MDAQNAFTVDLEEWYHGIELPRSSWPSESRLMIGLERLLTLMNEFSVKGTFFVLGVVAQKHPKVLQELLAEGHEIACHGDSHQFVFMQTPDEFRRDIREAIAKIEDACSIIPAGYRAPYFSVRSDSLWALEVLAEEGFSYDSSIFPIRNYRYGIADAAVEPHQVSIGDSHIYEIPLTPATIRGRRLPFSGGAYLRILPWSVQRLAWDHAARHNLRTIAYIHPWELDPDHPRIPLPKKIALTHYARLRVTERRLRKLMARYSFGRIDAVFSAG